MNKTPIYAISITIIIVLAVSIIWPGLAIIRNIRSGFNPDIENSFNDAYAYIPIELEFQPTMHQMISGNDSILFDNGEKVKFVMERATLFLPEKQIPTWSIWVSMVCFLFTFLLLCVLVWVFVRFNINISKERIFIERNAVYLRYFSYCLILIAILEIALRCVDLYIICNTNLSLAGYEITTSWIFPWTNFLIGLVSLLISLVWSRGIQIKKDQELTI